MWVLHPVVTARMIDYVDYHAVISAHCITYALLKHWGYHHLALLVLSSPATTSMSNNLVKQQVTDEQVEQLYKIYPHYPNHNVKRKPTRRDANVAIVAIRKVVAPLYSSLWNIAPWEQPNLYPNIRMDGRTIGIPHDIEPMLANLIIFLKTKVHPGLTSAVTISRK